MNETHESVVNRERQVKFAQTHVAAVEKYYGLLCQTLGSVIRKSARLRDKSDIFAHHLKEYAGTEKLTNSTKTSLLSFAENLSTVQDYRNTEVQRLEAKVLKPLMKYGDLCKNMKSSIKGSQNACTREKKQSEKLRKLQQKAPASTPQIAQADLQRVRHQAAQYEEQLVTEVDQFEKSKLIDMKSVLSEFVQIEMMFHARALEYLSRCYEAAQRIETEVDMDHFRAALFGASGLPQSFTQTAASSSYTSFAQGTVSSSHHTPPQPLVQRSMYNDADDSEEDDDDYDDDDDDEEDS